MHDPCVQVLISTGTVLLSAAALIGFQLHRTQDNPSAYASWRLVHNGGTAGGVQLLALGSVWSQLTVQSWTALSCALCVSVGTWLMFLGPLLTALTKPRLGKWLAHSGALLSVPGYILLVVFAATRALS